MTSRSGWLAGLCMVIAVGCAHAEAGAGGEAPPKVGQIGPPGWEPGPPEWQSVGQGGWLVTKDGAELGFVERTCAYGGHCGCTVPAEHRYTRTRDGWRIVVVLPEVVVRKIVKAGSCRESCGVEAPPPPQPVRGLGKIDPNDVEVVVRRPRKVVWKKTCKNPMPAV
jgi:hypothetical protein